MAPSIRIAGGVCPVTVLDSWYLLVLEFIYLPLESFKIAPVLVEPFVGSRENADRNLHFKHRNTSLKVGVFGI